MIVSKIFAISKTLVQKLKSKLKAAGKIYFLELDGKSLMNEIDRHSAKRKLLLHATQLAHRHGHDFRKLLSSSGPVATIVVDHLSELSGSDFTKIK